MSEAVKIQSILAFVTAGPVAFTMAAITAFLNALRTPRSGAIQAIMIENRA